MHGVVDLVVVLIRIGIIETKHDALGEMSRTELYIAVLPSRDGLSGGEAGIPGICTSCSLSKVIARLYDIYHILCRRPTGIGVWFGTRG